MALLPTIEGPADLRGLSDAQLTALAAEIRQTIIATVARTGGHLGSSLGVVELTIALHRLLESPRDRIVWDTGHQAYAHKLLTGRLATFGTLRQLDGIGGFPRRSESPHDVFDGGHAGTGLSIAQGLATARDLRRTMERIAVVVGDAALGSGLSLEALNDIGHRHSQLLIVLNDNEMSISPSVGAFSRYFSTLKVSPAWRSSRTVFDRTVGALPFIGRQAVDLSRRIRRSVVSFAQPGQLFEDLGITYLGVVPGHDLQELDHMLRAALAIDGPVLVHVRTRKGAGYRPAELDRVAFHGAALPPMTDAATLKVEGAGTAPTAGTEPGSGPKRPPNYTATFVDELVEAARSDRRIVAITAGMPTGTGLHRFQEAFPDRFMDVGIAEQHAMTLAAGLALGGERPVVAIYSTFLQRAFDQQVHDVCQNDLPVVIAVDRAGLVGEDGTSHQGMFTLPTQLELPYLVVASPRDEQELRSLTRTALASEHPFALHYPRDAGFGLAPREPRIIPIGQAEVLREGADILIVGFGPIVERGRQAADLLAADGWSVGLVDARFAKPLDRQLILDEARGRALVVTLEESVVSGGFGSAVLRAIEEARLVEPAFRDTAVRLIGLPSDRFVDHGPVDELRRLVRLDTAGIAAQIRESIGTLGLVPRGAAAAGEAAGSAGHSAPDRERRGSARGVDGEDGPSS